MDITEIRKIHELMGRVDKDAVAHHLWGKPYDDLSDEQKALLDRPMEVTEADVPKKPLFKPATPEQRANRPQPEKKRGRTTLKFHLWEFLPIEEMNNILDEELYDSSVFPSDIHYTCQSITPDGEITLEADYAGDEFTEVEEQ